MPFVTRPRQGLLPGKPDSAILLAIEKAEERTSAVVKSSPGLVKKILIHISGISLIVLGIAGLFLPFLQGIFLIVAGVGLLSTGNERVTRWVKGLRKKYPKPTSVFKTIKEKIVSQSRSLSNPGSGGSEK